jgi:hypothetical protein
VAKRKILRIAQGEYLLDANKDGVVTTYNKESAMDISDWKFDQLAYFISNLHKVGYIKAKVEEIEIPEEVEENPVKEDEKENEDV